MKALVYTKPNAIELQDIAEPHAQSGEVLVKVDAVGICGSYMHAYHGHDSRRPAPLVLGHPVADPETVASAIRIGNPASWDLAMAAAQESGGRFRKATDDQILAAQRELASREGVFVEPASAAGVAGLLIEHDEGADLRGKTVVVTVTGHGLKDIDTALSGFTDLVDTVVDADVESAARAAGLA